MEHWSSPFGGRFRLNPHVNGSQDHLADTSQVHPFPAAPHRTASCCLLRSKSPPCRVLQSRLLCRAHSRSSHTSCIPSSISHREPHSSTPLMPTTNSLASFKETEQARPAPPLSHLTPRRKPFHPTSHLTSPAGSTWPSSGSKLPSHALRNPGRLTVAALAQIQYMGVRSPCCLRLSKLHHCLTLAGSPRLIETYHHIEAHPELQR